MGETRGQGDKETRGERAIAMVNGALVSVIDCAVGTPVGEAILTVARVQLRKRNTQSEQAKEIAPRLKAVRA